MLTGTKGKIKNKKEVFSEEWENKIYSIITSFSAFAWPAIELFSSGSERESEKERKLNNHNKNQKENFLHFEENLECYVFEPKGYGII